MGKNLNIEIQKDPVTIIYGEVKDIQKDRIKGNQVSWIIVQTTNRRIHRLLFYGGAPMHLLSGKEEKRAFVVREKSRVHSYHEMIMGKKTNKVERAIPYSKLSITVADEKGNKIEMFKEGLKPSDVYVLKKENITDMVIVDLDLNPKSI